MPQQPLLVAEANLRQAREKFVSAASNPRRRRFTGSGAIGQNADSGATSTGNKSASNLLPFRKWCYNWRPKVSCKE
jgi:hypothetical protein